MTETTNKYADFEGLRERAVALRREGLSRRQIRDRLHVDDNDILNRLLEGEPAPEWTKRPRAKDDVRAKARELRLQGMTYDQIQVELGCSKSSISLWVRDLPKPVRQRTREESSAIGRRGWEATLQRRDAERRAAKQKAADEIGIMTDRELFLLGVGLYWAEGSKSKPYRTQERVTFVNSDPGMNVGENYRGCLAVRVLKSAELYRRIEGSWCGIVGAAKRADQENRT
ncbi:hypothetical protein [Streptomyces sp. rh34]|uniref:hypothetical protein n=1 Tax=Streptomyces sp. rh34 TaxID=2034272 RepID=UPI000BEFB23F|nr:hypothetical protein [Streptomyces sp. rh34]